MIYHMRTGVDFFHFFLRVGAVEASDFGISYAPSVLQTGSLNTAEIILSKIQKLEVQKSVLAEYMPSKDLLTPFSGS